MSTLLHKLHGRLPGYALRQALKRRIARVPFFSQRWLVEGYTWLSVPRLKSLESQIRRIERERVPGVVVECGVATGGSAALLGLSLDRARSQRQLYLFDTFEGLPPATADDPDYEDAVQWTGQCRGELHEVQKLFADLRIAAKTHFVKGLFADTLPNPPFDAVAFAHLDGDWYESTKTCLVHLWPRLSVGGAVQFDDYGRWEGCRKAVDEFFAGKHGEYRLDNIDGIGVAVTKLR